MTVWIAVALTSGLAAFWLARAFLRRGGVELADGEQAISVYRDQLDAVRRDAARGLISGGELAAAEREIEARALRAARDLDNGLLVPRGSRRAAAGVALAAIAGSALMYGWLGTPEAPDQPLATRQAKLLAQRAAAGDPAALARVVEREMAEAPEGFEKWWTLAEARSAAGDYAAAAEAYRKAAEASGDRPSVLSAYAEALTLANGNKVPPLAKIVFGQVLARQPLDPRARYYAALGKAQAQDFRGALADWLALYGDSAPDAPWAPKVRQDIVNMARFTSTRLASVLPDATAEEIAFAASGRPQPAGAGGDRVAELEAVLAAQPKDYAASIELARLHAAAGETGKAAAAIEAAQARYAGAPFVQQRLSEAARSLGLVTTGAPAADLAPRGPTDEQVAAAGAMSEDERSAMISGMVEGLADRLETQPDDLEGWLMLIRSYAVLQDAERATAAAAKALAQFSGRPQQQASIRATANEFGISAN